jgi:hypothetical protein
VTSVFSLFSATESTEKKIFAAPQDPTNWCYSAHEGWLRGGAVAAL